MSSSAIAAINSLRYKLRVFPPYLSLIKLRNTLYPSADFTSPNQSRLRVGSKVWTDGKSFSPDLYKQLDPKAIMLLNELEHCAAKTDKILDICCNIGRHLNELTSRGFVNLYGFDIMPEAINSMHSFFPAINRSNISLGSAYDVIPAYSDNSFDWAYTHSATIELFHPAFPLHFHLSRLVSKGFVFLLNESSHQYPRYYKYLYRRAGFTLVKLTTFPQLKEFSRFSLQLWVKNSYLDTYRSTLHSSCL